MGGPLLVGNSKLIKIVAPGLVGIFQALNSFDVACSSFHRALA